MRNPTKRRLRRSRSRRGFTLIEMMVAVAVVAMAALVVYQSNSGALRFQGSLEQKTIGHWVLDDHINKYQIDQMMQQQPLYGLQQINRVFQAGFEYEVLIDEVSLDNEYIDQYEFSVYRVINSRVENDPIHRSVTFVQQPQDI